jgi:hypothetical protein
VRIIWITDTKILANPRNALQEALAQIGLTLPSDFDELVKAHMASSQWTFKPGKQRTTKERKELYNLRQAQKRDMEKAAKGCKYWETYGKRNN